MKKLYLAFLVLTLSAVGFCAWFYLTFCGGYHNPIC